MADDDEVEPAKEELARLGGQVANYLVPDEALDELEAAADEADVEETEEAELLHEQERPVEAAVPVAATATAEEATAAMDRLPVAILHYQRLDGDYDGWGIHVWTGHEGWTAWEAPLPPAGSDDFGVYFEVPVAPGAEGLAYIIHRGDEKDLWDDQYLIFAEHGYEVWITQSSPGYLAAP